ncbi:MAG: hypothetical protein EOP46_07645 [Sphingobacteriaceae bacterium]|nr:MAG: hypothetical protein EOP46_07645 [Sphingobacteriaceae bacterium]
MVTDIHDTTFNNYKAVLVKGTQYAHGATFAKEILMFGDADKTIMVASACPETDKALMALLQKSAFSVQYDENQQAKPEDAVAFSIDTTGTNFILEPNMNGILSYKLKGEPDRANVMFMAAGSVATVFAEDKKAYTLTRLKKLPGHENDKIISCVPVKIDGLPGYEVVATQQLASKAVNEKILLVMLYSTENGYYYMIAGIAKKDVEKHMDTFKKMSRTFKRKKT